MEKIGLNMIKWHNEKRKVKDLISCPHNPRKWDEKQLENLKKYVMCGSHAN